MDIAELQSRVHPLRPKNLLVSGAALLAVAACWRQTGMSVSELVKGSGNMVQYLAGTPSIPDSGFFPPDLSARMLGRYSMSMLETVEMAFLGVVLSVLISFPLSFLASRNTLEIIFPGRSEFWRALRGVLYSGTRLFGNLARSVNEIVWAMLFVSAVGLGPMPGILALGFHTSGVMIKLFSEGLDSISMEPVAALSSTGAGSLKVIRYAVVPQIAPFLVSMILYRLESDLRSATILGFTGAGGIGMILFDKLRSYENRDVTTILILIVITVAVIDRLSAFIRSKAS